MSCRNHLLIYWENHDDRIFRHACELAREIADWDDDNVLGNVYEHQWLVEPEWARVRLHKPAGCSEQLDQLWQLVKDWPATFANKKMIATLEKLRHLERCLDQRGTNDRLACMVNPDRNLRFAGCRRLYPALGPVDLGQSFEPASTYWYAGEGSGGLWRCFRGEIEEHWQRQAEELGLEFCPRYRGFRQDLELIPGSMQYGVGRAWRRLKDSDGDLCIFPADLPLPEGFYPWQERSESPESEEHE